MTTYAYPTITPQLSRWSLVSNAAVFRSISGIIQTNNRGGEHWEIELQHNALRGENKALMIAFLAKLNGAENRFTVYEHGHVQRGAFGGTPLVNGDDQTGETIICDGCSNSITNWIREGDRVGIDGRLYVSTADASSDGSGNITLSLRPRIRVAPPDDAAITTSNPTAQFLIVNPTSAWSNRPGGLADLVIQAVEDLAYVP